MQRLPPKKEPASELEATPTIEEIQKRFKEMKDSASGKDEVRKILIASAGPITAKRLFTLVQQLWNTPTEEWEEAVHSAVIFLLHKKGSKTQLDNYRGICLLAFISRLIARITAKRIYDFSEHQDLFLDVSWGFREYRSTAEEISFCRRLIDLAIKAVPADEGDRLSLELLDVKKAYPNTSRNAGT